MDIIERYLTEHGSVGAFGALLILKIGEMIWNYFRSRDASLTDLKAALEKNTLTMSAIQMDLKRFKKDLHRAFKALKKVSGDKWPEIVKEFDDLDH